MNIQKTNRRTMAINRHMRWSAFSAGRPGGLIREITWKAGNLEVICLHGRPGGVAAPISDERRKTLGLFLIFPYRIYAFRSIFYAFRSLHPKIIENLPINLI